MATCVILFVVLRNPYISKVKKDPEVWTIDQIYSYEDKADWQRFLALMRFAYLPEHFITNMLWMVYFFQSTKHRNLFSFKKTVMIVIWTLICSGVDCYEIYQNYDEDQSRNLKLLFPIFFNLLTNISNLIRYLAVKYRLTLWKVILQDFKEDKEMEPVENL